MGYRAPKTIYRLQFADEGYEGLEVEVASGTVGQYTTIAQLTSLDLTSLAGLAEGTEKVMALLRAFAAVLVRWNLEEDDGAPVPATLDGLLRQELTWLIPVIKAWLNAVGTPPAPLGQPSSDGARHLEGSLPMEVS